MALNPTFLTYLKGYTKRHFCRCGFTTLYTGNLLKIVTNMHTGTMIANVYTANIIAYAVNIILACALISRLKSLINVCFKLWISDISLFKSTKTKFLISAAPPFS